MTSGIANHVNTAAEAFETAAINDWLNEALWLFCSRGLICRGEAARVFRWTFIASVNPWDFDVQKKGPLVETRTTLQVCPFESAVPQELHLTVVQRVS